MDAILKEEQRAADEKSKKIAEYTEKLKSIVREGNEGAVKIALDEILAPMNKKEFPDYHVRKGFVQTILHEAEKRYGGTSEVVERLHERLDRFVEETWGL
ncbi:hypothetical protein HY413_03035 [Candidatus Kaiserbacteria bacterium]|nr:hypothetical protein [Candidatus Kaiserbacteria bacterium]